MAIRMLLVILLLGAIGFADVDGTRSDSAGMATPIERLDETFAAWETRHEDIVMLEISRRVPDWGGYYVGDDGVHVFMVNAPDVEEITKTTLATELSARVLNNAVAAENIIVEPAQYSMLQLLEWFWLTDFRTTMFDVPGVTSIAVYERDNGLFIGLETRDYESDVLSKLAEFGIPSDAAHFFVSGPVNFSTTLRDEVQPLVAGLNTSSGCTAGPVVEIWGFGEAFFTNSHCTNTIYSPDPIPKPDWYQPDTSGYYIGQEYLDSMPLAPSHPECGHSNGCVYADTAIIAAGTDVYHQGLIARTESETQGLPWADCAVDPSDCTINNNDPRIEIMAARVITPVDNNTIVSKIGIRTGWTSGRVIDNCAFLDGPKVFNCVIASTIAQGAGDSGSPVFEMTSSGAFLVGQNFCCGEGPDGFSPEVSFQNRLDKMLEAVGLSSGDVEFKHDNFCNFSLATEVGTTGPDNLNLSGVNGNHVIVGLGGNDQLTGGAGNDKICGNAGHDTINGNAGYDYANGGSGDDTMNLGSDDDFGYGYTGDDTINANEGIDEIQGAAGNDTLRGGDGNDTLYGGADDDLLQGQGGDEDTCYPGGQPGDVVQGCEKP